MPYQINRPTRREVQERLAESQSKLADKSLRGQTRTSEEAFETARRLERETGEAFTRPFAVAPDSVEAKKANESLLRQHGLDPEGHGYLNSESTRHG